MRRTPRPHVLRPLAGAAFAVAAAGLATAGLVTAGLATASAYAVEKPAYAVEKDAEPGARRLVVRPAGVPPGAKVTVGTAACAADGTATGDANAVGAGAFPLAPGTPPGSVTGRFRVPPEAPPGTYEIVARCAESGQKVAGDLVITAAARDAVHPRGSVKTGVGGALGPDPVQTAAGLAALAVAAAGGTWLLHRRARGEAI